MNFKNFTPSKANWFLWFSLTSLTENLAIAVPHLFYDSTMTTASILLWALLSHSVTQKSCQAAPQPDRQLCLSWPCSSPSSPQRLMKGIHTHQKHTSAAMKHTFDVMKVPFKVIWVVVTNLLSLCDFPLRFSFWFCDSANEGELWCRFYCLWHALLP